MIFMNSIRLLLSVAGMLACIWSGASSINDYTFSHLGIGDGVAGPHVFDICQTPDGVVWWSTKNTVDRYNGSGIRNYFLAPDAPYSHFAGRTIGLVLSRDGKDGLYAYDNKGRIFVYSLADDDFVPVADVAALFSGRRIILNHILVDNEGIWVALDAGTFLIKDGVLHSVLEKQSTHYILPCRQDEYILCTDGGLFRVKPSDCKTEFYYPFHAETAFYDSGTNRIWLGTFSSGVQVLDYGGAFVSARPVKNLPANPVRSIIALDTDTILLGVDGFGVFSVDSKGSSLNARLLFHANEGKGGVLHGNGVYSLLKDRWDDIFIGTYSGGVDVARPTNGIAQLLLHSEDEADFIHNNHINCVFSSPSWGTVLGTDDGLCIKRGELWSFSAAGLVVLDICDEGDALLLATFGKGVYRMERSGRVSQLYSKAGGQLKDDHVYSLCRSRDGHLWMGCLSGDLAELSPSGFSYFPVQNVQDIVQLPDGRMAVGTADGIRLVRSGSPAVEDLPYARADEDVNRYVLGLYVDGERLWIASDGGGLYGRDLTGGEPFQFTKKDGLPGNGVCSIVKASDGCLWLGTENGLCRLEPNGKVIPVNHIWMLNREYTRGASMLLPDGSILLGSTSGAVVLHPEKVESAAYGASLHLIGASFNSRSDKDRARKMALLLGPDPELNLAFKDNTFELQIESVNLRYQKDIVYQYSMDDGPWSSPSEEGRFRFAEVEAGSHQVRVRSLSRTANTILDEIVIPVNVAQPFWNTWWMWVIYILLVSGAFVGAWKIYQLHAKYMRLALTNPMIQSPAAHEAGEEEPKDGNGKEFVDSVTRIVLENLDKSDFSIDGLCREMAMSRTYLYMRLKAFTGESPQDFIRLIRMEKAAVLLRGGMSVSEVSDAVGFDNPKYFSTVFRKSFGVSPSKYR